MSVMNFFLSVIMSKAAILRFSYQEQDPYKGPFRKILTYFHMKLCEQTADTVFVTSMSYSMRGAIRKYLTHGS